MKFQKKLAYFLLMGFKLRYPIGNLRQETKQTYCII